MKWKASLIFSVLILSLIPVTYSGAEDVTDSQYSTPRPPMDTVIESTEIKDEGNINITSTGDEFNGYNLFILRQENRDLDADPPTENEVVIVHNNGTVVYSEDIGHFHSLDYLNAEFINSTHFMYAHPNGDIRMVNFETKEVVAFPNTRGHHEIEYNYKDDTFFTLEFYTRIIDEERYVYDNITEYDKNGNLLWNFDVFPLVPPENEVYEDIYTDGEITSKDVTHANTIFYDSYEDTILLNLRNANTFYKINRSNSDVIWGLGEYGNFTLYDIKGNEKESLFYNAHAVERINENRYIIFDNDRNNRTDRSSKNSRILEIEIDERAMEARVVWKYTAPKDYYTEKWGDADRLPNGNSLGTFGTETHPDTTIGARLVEVNQAGKIVWEMNFPQTVDYRYGIYRVERINFSPTIYGPKDTSLPVGETLDLSWDIYYNFRNKINFTGNYDIYVNGTLMRSEIHEFKQFWGNTPVSYEFSNDKPGLYNITIVVYDEGGHASSHAVLIGNKIYEVKRQGEMEIETGTDDIFITWSGFTTQQLGYRIFVNESVISGSWNGESIRLETGVLEPGTYVILFQLLNVTEIIYADTFLISVYPQGTPEVTIETTFLSYEWQEEKSLKMEFFDHTPAYIDISIDDVFQKKYVWTNKSKILTFMIPRLDEGRYDLVIIAADKAGLTTTKSIKIDVLRPSEPVVINLQSELTVNWGNPYSFSYEVHGVDKITLYRDGIRLKEINIQSKFVDIPVLWQQEQWRLGIYDLHLEFIGDSLRGFNIEFTVYFDRGDNYADSVIEEDSTNYADANNALGEPDKQYARITTGYSNGYITLDMGLREGVKDATGPDLKIHAKGGQYGVYVTNSLSGGNKFLDSYNGTISVDLHQYGVDEARYIQIAYFGGVDILVDAVEALNNNIPDYENTSPVLEEKSNLNYWSNESSPEIVINASSYSPWNYTLFIDNEVFETKPWEGGDIVFKFDWEDIKEYDITVVAYNLFGQSTTIQFKIKIVSVLLDITNFITFSAFVVTLVIGLAVGFRFFKKYG